MPPRNNPPIQSDVATSMEFLTSSHLCEEVYFWRELIRSMDESNQPRESLERMRQALALAEYRMASASKSFAPVVC